MQVPMVSRRGYQIPLEPALQVVKSGSKWEAGTKFWSSARTLEIMLLFYFIEIESHLELAIRPGRPWTNRDLPASSRIRGVCHCAPTIPDIFYTAKECFGMITGSNYPWAKSCQQILRAEGREIDVREPRETQLYLLMGRCPQSSLKLQVESSHGISKAWQTTLKAMCEHWRRSASSKHQASLSYYLHCDSEPLLWTFHKDQEEKYLKGRFSPPWFGTARKVALLPWICCPPQEYL